MLINKDDQNIPLNRKDIINRRDIQQRSDSVFIEDCLGKVKNCAVVTNIDTGKTEYNDLVDKCAAVVTDIDTDKTECSNFVNTPKLPTDENVKLPDKILIETLIEILQKLEKIENILGIKE